MPPRSRRARLAPLRFLATLFILLSPFANAPLAAQTFEHPGGLHTLADLERMKAKVAAGETPWLQGWNRLITDSQARKTYVASARADLGANRQRASADAHAAYLNAVRWYVSGDIGHADTAVAICNAWSAAVNQIPTGDSLVSIPVFDFAMAGEVLRAYPGWAPADFARFQNMMRVYLYPRCHDFLTTHNGACISNSWSNWDICNYGALIAMGVLLDDPAIFEEGVEYFKTGAGTGSIFNAIPYLHPGGLGQWQESGRDQEHAQLAVGMMAAACQIAWNQGVDLFAYADNRLLAGAEYVARTNLSRPVPYTHYTNCQNANQSWVSLNGLGRLDDRPVWELVYNHYVVRRGLAAPHVAAIAALMRPEHGSADHFGYGTLTFTLDGAASPYPPLAVPAAPTGLRATAGVGRVTLDWDASAAHAAQGYRVQRATSASGTFTTLASWNENTFPRYIDATAANGTTYHYRVAALNQSGTGANTSPVFATPLAATPALTAGWTSQTVGAVTTTTAASYANLVGGTFLVTATGGAIGGAADAGYHYTHTSVTGDFTLTARLSDIDWDGGGGRIGLMLRETLDADSRAVVLTLGGTGNRQARAGFRATTGGNLNNYGGNDYTWTPAWFRLARVGDTVTASESSDGLAWFPIRSATVAMAATCHAGFLAITGVNTAVATFDHVFPELPVVAPALRTRLDFDDAATDAIGPLHGALSGAPAYVAGRHGRALALDGADDFVTLPANALPALVYPALTLATWVRWDGGAQWQRLLDFGAGTSAYLFITPRSGNNTLRFAIKNGGAEQRLDAPQLVTGEWIHLAVTLGDGVGRLYVNGALAATNPAMSIRPGDFATDKNFLGDSQFSADPLFAGRLDDFRLYNHVLEAAEIAALATPPTALEVWKISHDLDAALDASTAPDGDGLPLLLKYATGLAPGAPAVSPLTITSADDALALTFPRLSPAPVTYVVQASSDLLVWSPIATLARASDLWTGPAHVTESSASATTRAATVRDTAALSTEPRRFLRLEVTEP